MACAFRNKSVRTNGSYMRKLKFPRASGPNPRQPSCLCEAMAASSESGNRAAHGREQDICLVSIVNSKAWQETARLLPDPNSHSCYSHHKRLLTPTKNKPVILIKEHSWTLETEEGCECQFLNWHPLCAWTRLNLKEAGDGLWGLG